MINIKELRIGNLAYSGDKKLSRIYGIEENDLSLIRYNFLGLEIERFGTRIKNVEPIPITEELLVRFGFENTSRFEWCLGGIKINFYNSGEFTLDYFGKEMLRKARGKYVHQLQNLYFALTGTELEFKA